MLVEWLASSDLSLAGLAVNVIIMIDVQCFRRLMGEYSFIILRTCNYIFYIYAYSVYMHKHMHTYTYVPTCIPTYLPIYDVHACKYT